jgi:putative transposase
MEEHLTEYPRTVSCHMLGVSCAGYYAWQKRPVSPRQQRHEVLAARIAVVHQEHRQVYGSPRICRVLNANGPEVCRNTVAKIMRERNIRAKTKKKFVPRTTDSRHD